MAGSGTRGRYGNVARAIQIKSKPYVHDLPDTPDGGYGIGLGATGGVALSHEPRSIRGHGRIVCLQPWRPAPSDPRAVGGQDDPEHTPFHGGSALLNPLGCLDQ